MRHASFSKEQSATMANTYKYISKSNKKTKITAHLHKTYSSLIKPHSPLGYNETRTVLKWEQAKGVPEAAKDKWDKNKWVSTVLQPEYYKTPSLACVSPPQGRSASIVSDARGLKPSGRHSEHLERCYHSPSGHCGPGHVSVYLFPLVSHLLLRDSPVHRRPTDNVCCCSGSAVGGTILNTGSTQKFHDSLSHDSESIANLEH